MFGHLVTVVAVLTCLWLGDWQWFRAETTGSVQNWGYALQWPLFAVCFVVGWWRMLRLESRRLDDLEAEAAAGADATVESSVDKPADSVEDTTPAVENTPEPVEKPARADVAPAGDAEDPEDAALAAYNRMLRELAERDAATHR